MQNFQILTKISARFPDFNEGFWKLDSSADFDILILNFRMMYLLHTCRLTVYKQELTFINTLIFHACAIQTQLMYEVIGIYMHACRLSRYNIQGAYNVVFTRIIYMYKQ